MNILLENINRIYHDNDRDTTALCNINLSINSGDEVVIIGESGAGKSTLLNILGLIDSNYTGNYFIDEKNVRSLKSKDKSKLLNNTFGFIFQEYALIEDDTVFNNVKIPLIYSDIKRKYYKKMIQEILSLVELENLTYAKVSTLSGGQRQRVAIARALVNKPSIILADEPTGSLDDRMTAEVMDIIYKYLDDTKISLLVTHDVKRIKRDSQKFIKLNNGKLQFI